MMFKVFKILPVIIAAVFFFGISYVQAQMFDTEQEFTRQDTGIHNSRTCLVGP